MGYSLELRQPCPPLRNTQYSASQPERTLLQSTFMPPFEPTLAFPNYVGIIPLSICWNAPIGIIRYPPHSICSMRPLRQMGPEKAIQ